MNILDNDFRNPDLHRYRERFERFQPDIGIVGDAYSEQEAQDILDVIDDFRDQYPASSFVAVPKNRTAFDVLSGETVLGFANGYSDVSPDDFSDLADWRNERVWILGGSPHSQYDVIQKLTQPTLAGDPPADIWGVDGNGVLKAAWFGEYWDADGYQPADHLSIRETVSRSLLEIKGFWQSHGVWPESTPLEEYGPAVLEPDDPVYATGGDIRTREELETAYVEAYDGELTRAYQSETAKRFVEYRDGLS